MPVNCIPRLCLLLLSLAASSGCARSTDASALPFTPAQGVILVTHGSPAEVRAAIVDYDGLVAEQRPGRFRVELHPQASGAVAVTLPDGLPAYDLANMTGWLSAPPNQPGVEGAAVWITAPDGRRRYYLQPETGNPAGDTLIGASAQGMPVRVSLPEGAMSEVSTPHPYRDAPAITRSTEPLTLTVTLDTDTAFGNPQFHLNSPKDPAWHR